MQNTITTAMHSPASQHDSLQRSFPLSLLVRSSSSSLALFIPGNDGDKPTVCLTPLISRGRKEQETRREERQRQVADEERWEERREKSQTSLFPSPCYVSESAQLVQIVI